MTNLPNNLRNIIAERFSDFRVTDERSENNLGFWSYVVKPDGDMVGVTVSWVPYCCGAMLFTVMGELPKDVLALLINSVKHSGYLIFLHSPVIPDNVYKLSDDVGVFKSDLRAEEYYRQTPPFRTGQYWAKVFYYFKTLLVVAHPGYDVYQQEEISPLLPPITHEQQIELRTRVMNSVYFTGIGKDVLFVYDVPSLRDDTIKFALDTLRLSGRKALVGITSEYQTDAIDLFGRFNFDVAVSGPNPGSKRLLRTHVMTQEKAETFK